MRNQGEIEGRPLTPSPRHACTRARATALRILPFTQLLTIVFGLPPQGGGEAPTGPTSRYSPRCTLPRQATERRSSRKAGILAMPAEWSANGPPVATQLRMARQRTTRWVHTNPRRCRRVVAPRAPSPGAPPLPITPPAYSNRVVLVSPRATTQHEEVVRGIRPALDPGDTRRGGPARLHGIVCGGGRAAADWTRARRCVEPPPCSLFPSVAAHPACATPRVQPRLTPMEWRRSHLAQSGEPDGQEKLAPRTACLEIVRTASLHPREAQLARGEGSASVHTGLSTDHGRIALGDEGREVSGTAPQGDRESNCPT